MRRKRREEEQEEERKKEGKTRMERKKTFVRRNFHYFLISYERNTDQPSQFYPSRSDARQEMRDKDRASTIIGYDGDVYNRWRSKVKSQQEEKSDERGLVFFFSFSFFFASLFGARFFLSPPHLSTLHLRNYTRGVNRGFYTDSSASIPCTRNLNVFHRDILHFFQRLPASLLGRYNMTDRSRTSR